jgi:hypothetical protein
VQVDLALHGRQILVIERRLLLVSVFGVAFGQVEVFAGDVVL